MVGAKQYKCGRFTVTVDHMDPEMQTEGTKGFKWVRIYANVWTIDYCAGTGLLLACESGVEPAHVLLAKARKEAAAQLSVYKERAEAILAL